VHYQLGLTTPASLLGYILIYSRKINYYNSPYTMPTLLFLNFPDNFKTNLKSPKNWQFLFWNLNSIYAFFNFWPILRILSFLNKFMIFVEFSPLSKNAKIQQFFEKKIIKKNYRCRCYLLFHFVSNILVKQSSDFGPFILFLCFRVISELLRVAHLICIPF
jgi:hypothetical protein